VIEHSITHYSGVAAKPLSLALEHDQQGTRPSQAAEQYTRRSSFSVLAFDHSVRMQAGIDADTQPQHAQMLGTPSIFNATGSHSPSGPASG
jgi:hypothetical protein